MTQRSIIHTARSQSRKTRRTRRNLYRNRKIWTHYTVAKADSNYEKTGRKSCLPVLYLQNRYGKVTWLLAIWYCEELDSAQYDTAQRFEKILISRRRRNQFNPLVSGPGQFEWWKKLGVENLSGLSLKRKHLGCRNQTSEVYTVRKFLADFTVCDWWRFCKALCDVKFRQIEGNGRLLYLQMHKNVNAMARLWRPEIWRGAI